MKPTAQPTFADIYVFTEILWVGIGVKREIVVPPSFPANCLFFHFRFQWRRYGVMPTTDDVQMRVYENTAVEAGLSTMVGQDKGKAVARDTRFTRVWVKQQGRWRLPTTTPHGLRSSNAR